MRNSLVIFSIVVYLFIRGIQLAQPSVEVVQNVHCTSGTFNQSRVHIRRRRHLVFEKGAAFSIAASATKSLIAATPRGLSLVCEEIIYYELPSSILIPKVESSTPQSTKLPRTKVEIKEKKLTQKFSSTYPGYTPNYMYKYKRDADSTNTTDTIGGINTNSLDIEALFFQQLERFAELYGYNGGHCIMRTICEAQHFLFPRGQSLFHDIIRIILDFSSLTIRNNKKYFTASRTVNPMDCANLYGPHCKISFLDYFTVQIHGKYM